MKKIITVMLVLATCASADAQNAESDIWSIPFSVDSALVADEIRRQNLTDFPLNEAASTWEVKKKTHFRKGHVVSWVWKLDKSSPLFKEIKGTYVSAVGLGRVRKIIVLIYQDDEFKPDVLFACKIYGLRLFEPFEEKIMRQGAELFSASIAPGLTLVRADE